MCGPPGKGSPSKRATLSKASPAASSMVAPSGSTPTVTSVTWSSDECPPETSMARQGSGSGPCSSWSTATWAARWLTPYSGFSSPTASAFAAATPTSSAPARPGPAVTAIASTSARRTPDSRQARSIVGTIASRCARLATSGTTPPNRACSSTLLATASTSRVSPRTMPTPVSSQEVSIPRTSGSSRMRGLPHQSAPHDDGVHIARAGPPVVPPAHRHLLEPVPLVQPSRRHVVGPHLEHHRLGPAVRREPEQLLEQQVPEATPAMGRDDGDRHHVSDVAAVVQPGIPLDAALPVQDEVCASRPAGQLGPPGLDGPRVVREQLGLERGQLRAVAPGHRAEGAHPRADFVETDGAASGRRR